MAYCSTIPRPAYCATPGGRVGKIGRSKCRATQTTSSRYREADQTGIARQGFARGLAVVSDSVVAGGSSPSTVSLYDLAKNERVLSVTLTMDVRNAIHGLELWPFD